MKFRNEKFITKLTMLKFRILGEPEPTKKKNKER
jgi:hypothetical protein